MGGSLHRRYGLGIAVKGCFPIIGWIPMVGKAPEIMDSDQGSHFTGSKYTGIFLVAGSRISMDHRGRAYDNIFIERLWRTYDGEELYLSIQAKAARLCYGLVKNHAMVDGNKRIGVHANRDRNENLCRWCVNAICRDFYMVCIKVVMDIVYRI